VTGRRLELQRIVRMIGKGLARIEGAAAGAANKTARPELDRQFTRHGAGADRAVLQRGGVVVEIDQQREAGADDLDERADRLGAGIGEIRADAAGDGAVHHQPVAEGEVGDAQHLLAQGAAVRVHQAEGRVVADCADVANVVGEPLEFGHQRPQPLGARRRLDIQRRFERAGEGDRVGHRRVAAGASREPRGVVDGCASHPGLQASVHVAQPLLQADHRLAGRGEAEVSGLDDPGVHGPDRNAVQAFALGVEEPVGRALRRLLGAKRMTMRPAALVQPGPSILRAVRRQPIEVADRPLEPDRSRDMAANRREGARRTAERQYADTRLTIPGRHVDAAGLAPEGHEPQRAVGEALDGAAPLLGIDPDRAHPRSLATCWNHWVISGGKNTPAVSTSARCPNIGRYEALARAAPGDGSPKARPWRRSSRAPNAIIRPNTSGTAKSGWRAKVELTTRNSEVKMPKGGRPAMAITLAASVQPSTG